MKVLILLPVCVLLIFSSLSAVSGSEKRIKHSDGEIAAMFDGVITAYMLEKGIAGQLLLFPGLCTTGIFRAGIFRREFINEN